MNSDKSGTLVFLTTTKLDLDLLRKMSSDSQTRLVSPTTSDQMLHRLRTDNLKMDMAINGLLFCIHAFFLKERRECLELGAPLVFVLFVPLRIAFGTFLVVNVLAFVRDAVVLTAQPALHDLSDPMGQFNRNVVTFMNKQIKRLTVFGFVLFVIALVGAVGKAPTPAYSDACNPSGKFGLVHYIPAAVWAAPLASILGFTAMDIWEEYFVNWM